MVWIDIVLFLLLLLEVLKGAKDGLLSQAGTITGILLGFLIASASGDTMARFLGPVFGNSVKWSGVLGFLFTFLAVFLLIVILAKIFEGFLKALSLGFMNRVAGAVFCLLRGLLVLSIVLNLYQKVDEDCSLLGTEKVRESVLFKPVQRFAALLFPHFGLFQHEQDQIEITPKTKQI